MLARESKVPPGFSGAVRVFYQGEVSGFHLTTLQLSGSSRFLITHTLGGVFELNISPSGIIFPTSFWNGQREQEYTFIYDLDKNLHGHRGRIKYLFGVWSLIWTSRACFFFWVQDHFATEPPLGYNHTRGFGRVRHFLTREHFVNPAAVEHLLLAFLEELRSFLFLFVSKKQTKHAQSDHYECI